jgi:hypothetical protein
MRSSLLSLFVACSVLGGASLQAARPTIVSASGTAGANGSATLTATINPGGELTTVEFRYGLKESYGSVAAAPNIAGDAGEKKVTVTLSGLVGGKKYHFTVAAENAPAAASRCCTRIKPC